MLASMGQISGAMSQLFGSIAGDSKALQSFQKALAFAEIMANMAIGISRAISKTGGEPFSTTALITTVVTGITSAIGILKKTETPPVPSQLNTGAGGGATPTMSIPSINVPTEMANPTLALQASRQSEMQLNNTDNVMQAVSSMPAPQVEVKEITQGINNVQVKENRSKF